MSVFIALISEAYEKAKSELKDVEDESSFGLNIVVENPAKCLDQAHQTLDSITSGLITPDLVETMKAALPKPREKHDESYCEMKTSACRGRKRDSRRWRSGPLHDDAWPPNSEPLDLWKDNALEWIRTNDLKQILDVDKELEEEVKAIEEPKRMWGKRIKKGMVVCLASDENKRGIVVKREGNRASIDFDVDGKAVREGLAAISNALVKAGSPSGSGQTMKLALEKALHRRRAAESTLHPSDWQEEDVATWARQCGIDGLSAVAEKFKEHGVNGQCLLLLDSSDLVHIGVTKVADYKRALVAIARLKKIPKPPVSKPESKPEPKRSAQPPRNRVSSLSLSPSPAAKKDVGGALLPGSAPVDDITAQLTRDAQAGTPLDLVSDTVNSRLINPASGWVQIKLDERWLYHNVDKGPEASAVSSLQMPPEGIKGAKVLSQAERSSFDAAYDRASTNDLARKSVAEAADQARPAEPAELAEVVAQG